MNNGILMRVISRDLSFWKVSNYLFKKREIVKIRQKTHFVSVGGSFFFSFLKKMKFVNLI